MIRHKRGDEFLLITQHDHAQFSGVLARHLGNDRFAPPSPREPVIQGISLHDCGWPVHDDDPTLNPRGLPLHVLESPMSVATRVWTESARRAAEADPYAGLLVSLHVLTLSNIAQSNDPTPHERAMNEHDRFELNKFQHRQVEWQEGLRRRLGLRTDIPLRLGLAEPGTNPEEDLLRFNFSLLRAMDGISLDLCCSEDLFPTTNPVHTAPGADAVKVRIEHRGPGRMALDPWPFDRPRIEQEMPCRRVRAAPFVDEGEFRAAYAAAPREVLPLSVEAARD